MIMKKFELYKTDSLQIRTIKQHSVIYVNMECNKFYSFQISNLCNNNERIEMIKAHICWKKLENDDFRATNYCSKLPNAAGKALLLRENCEK